jgi:hypothetical protein
MQGMEDLSHYKDATVHVGSSQADSQAEASAAQSMVRMAVIVLVAVLAVPAFYVCFIWYLDASADRDAQQFCRSIPIGSDVATAVERFEERDERSGWMHYGNEAGHSFRFPIMMTDSAYCDVALDAQGRVVKKNAYVLYD